MPSIPPLHSIPLVPMPGSKGSSRPDAFQSILQQSIQNVSHLQSDADTAVNQFISGEQDDPHTMMMAVQRSSLSFDMFVQVRNKVVQAYQEVMKMPE